MKVAICIPCHGDPKAFFTLSLARLINFTRAKAPRIEIEIFLARSANIYQSRQTLVDWAREWGADFILWLDADHTFNPGALLKLISRKLDVVGTVYRRRQDEVFPTAAKRTDDGWLPVLPTAAKAAADELEEVQRMGLGLALVRMDALAKLEAPLFELAGVGGHDISEDALLCQKLSDAGVRLYVDHWLSMDMGHIAETVLKFPPTTIAVPVKA